MPNVLSSPSQRIFAIGDIHGNNVALQHLLGRLPACPQNDVLVFMGDYINRGPDTRGVLDSLLAVRERFAHTVFLAGNHEHLLLQYAAHGDVETLRTLRGMGLEATLESYGATVRDLPDLAFMPSAHRQFMQQLSLSYTNIPYLFVHADTDEVQLAGRMGAEGVLGNDATPHDAVLIDRALSSRRLVKEHPFGMTGDGREADDGQGAADGVSLVVFAHAPFDMPLVMPDRICVDTGAVHGNMLTALELPARRFYHA